MKPDSKKLRDPDWVCERLGLKRGTVFSMVCRGQLPGIVRLGPRLWRVDEDVIEAWLSGLSDKREAK